MALAGHKVKVAVRARPLNQREIDSNAKLNWKIGPDSLQSIDPETHKLNPKGFYNFDNVFGPEVATKEVYNDIVAPIVEEAFKGFNGTVLCYGQTSSGKTHTLYGGPNDPGIIDLLADDIMGRMIADSSRQYVFKVNLIEIYNEIVKDLLNSENPIEIVETKGVVVPRDVEDLNVLSAEEISKAAQRLQRERKIGETRMNSQSSRSHTIIRITIQIIQKTVDDDGNSDSNTESDNGMISAVLNFVDLAGSEKASESGAVGERLKEANHINTSLSALSKVVMQLSEKWEKESRNASAAPIFHSVGKPLAKPKLNFVSYRDSKLTRLLQSSLDGDALVAIICTVTPASLEETTSTLRFANSAKKIQTKPKQHIIAPTDKAKYESKIQELQYQLFGKSTELEKLKQTLSQYTSNEPDPERRMTFFPGMLFNQCPKKLDVSSDDFSNVIPVSRRSMGATCAYTEGMGTTEALKQFREAKVNQSTKTFRAPLPVVSSSKKLDQEVQTDFELPVVPAKRRRLDIENNDSNSNTPVSVVRMHRTFLSLASDEDRQSWNEEKEFWENEVRLLKEEIQDLQKQAASTAKVQSEKLMLSSKIDDLKCKYDEEILNLKSSKEFEVDILDAQIKTKNAIIKQLKTELNERVEEQHDGLDLDPNYMKMIQEEVLSFKTQTASLKGVLQERDNERQTNTEKINLLNNELLELRNSKDLLTVQMEKMKSCWEDNKLLADELSDLKVSLQVKEDELTSVNQKFLESKPEHVELNESQQSNDKLKLAESEKRNEEVSANYAMVLQQINQAVNEKTQLQNDLSERQLRIDCLASQMTELDNHLQDFKDKLAKAENQNMKDTETFKMALEEQSNLALSEKTRQQQELEKSKLDIGGLKSELTNQIQNLNAKIIDLERLNLDDNNHKQILDTQHTQALNEKMELQQQLVQSMSDIEGLKSEIGDLTNQIQDLNGKIRDLEMPSVDDNNYKQILDTQNTQALNEKMELQQELAARQSEIKSLQSEMSSEIQSLKSIIVESENQNEEVSANYAMVLQQINQAVNEKTQLKNDLSERQSRVDCLSSEMTELGNHLQNLKDQLLEAENKNNKDAEDFKMTLEEQSNQASDAKVELQQELVQSKSEIQTLKSEIGDLTNQIENLNAKIIDLEMLSVDDNNYKQISDAQNTQALNEKMELQQELAARQSEIKSLQSEMSSEIQSLKIIIVELENQNEEVSANYAMVLQQINQAVNEKTQLQNDLSERQLRVDCLSSEMTELGNHLQNLKDQLLEAENKNKKETENFKMTLEEQSSQALNEKTEQQQEAMGLKSEIGDLRNQLQDLNTKIRDLEILNEEGNNYRQVLDNKNVQALNEKMELQQELAARQSEIKSLQSEMSREIQVLKGVICELETQIVEIKCNHERDLQDKSNEALVEKSELQHKVLGLQSNIKDLETKLIERVQEQHGGLDPNYMEMIQAELQSFKTQNVDLKGILQERDNERHTNSETIHLLKTELSELRNSKDLLSAQVQKMNSNSQTNEQAAVNVKYMDKLKEELKSCWKENKVLACQISELKAVLQVKEGELASVNQEFLESKSEKGVKPAVLESLYCDLDELRQNNDKLQTSLDKMSEQLLKATDENKTLNETVEKLQNIRRPSRVNRGNQTVGELDLEKYSRDLKVRLKQSVNYLEKAEKKISELTLNNNRNIKTSQDELAAKDKRIDELEGYILKVRTEKESLRERQVETGIQCQYIEELLERSKKGEPGLLPPEFPDVGQILKDKQLLENKSYLMEKALRKCECNVQRNNRLLNLNRSSKSKENSDPNRRDADVMPELNKPFVSLMGSASDRKRPAWLRGGVSTKTQSSSAFPSTLSILKPVTVPPSQVMEKDSSRSISKIQTVAETVHTNLHEGVSIERSAEKSIDDENEEYYQWLLAASVANNIDHESTSAQNTEPTAGSHSQSIKKNPTATTSEVLKEYNRSIAEEADRPAPSTPIAAAFGSVPFKSIFDDDNQMTADEYYEWLMAAANATNNEPKTPE